MDHGRAHNLGLLGWCYLFVGTVVGKQVRAALNVGENALSSEFLNAGNHSTGRGESLESDQVQRQADDVGCGHGGTRDRVSSSSGANPSGEDILARRKDINNATVVGEGCPGVRFGAGRNSKSIWRRGGAAV